jgi:anaerobic selenocysteine-containing dehydrogenase
MSIITKKAVRTLCPICGFHILDIIVENNTVVSVKAAPLPTGGVCSKAVSVLKWHYPKEIRKTTSPMIRLGKGGPWKKVSWDDALDYVAAELKKIKIRDGSQATGLLAGAGLVMGTRVALISLERFADQYGCWVYHHGETCVILRMLAHWITCGDLLVPDLDPKAKSGSIWLWGMNPSASCPPMAEKILKKKKDCAKLIVVDPRRIPLAKEADLYLPVRPTTDLALILGMINIIIKEGLYNKEFVNKYTVGFDKLKEVVSNYGPKHVEKITTIPASHIEAAAKIFVENQPAAMIVWMGIEGGPHGFQFNRAAAILNALVGNIDREGGMILREWVGGIAGAHVSTTLCAGMPYSIYPKYSGHGSMASFPETVLRGDPIELKALILWGYNPIRMHGDSNRVREALKKAEIVVQVDVQMNEISEYADVFLPARALFEKQDIMMGGAAQRTGHVALVQPCIKPAGEALDDFEIIRRLSQRFGFKTWETFEEAVNDVLKPINYSFNRLKAGEPWYFEEPYEKWKFRNPPFKTPSGKFEIYSSILEKERFDPIPVYREAVETPLSSPELARKYPLIAIDFRSPNYFHSRFHDCPEIRKIEKEPLVEINPKDAETYRIANGDIVIIESLRGRIEMKAKVTEDIKEGVVGMPIGWPQANPNILSSSDYYTRTYVVGGDRLRGYLVKVEKRAH